MMPRTYCGIKAHVLPIVMITLQVGASRTRIDRRSSRVRPAIRENIMIQGTFGVIQGTVRPAIREKELRTTV
jgi:hypothetical protein